MHSINVKIFSRYAQVKSLNHLQGTLLSKIKTIIVVRERPFLDGTPYKIFTSCLYEDHIFLIDILINIFSLVYIESLATASNGKSNANPQTE